MNIFESVILAIDAVRSHKLRSSLTLFSIAIGIFAIIGSGTAVTSLNETVSKQMAEMGEGVFVLQKFPPVMSNDMWKKLRGRKDINFQQAKLFQQKMIENAEAVGIENSTGGIKVKYGNLSTDQNVSVAGGDDAYFITTNIMIEYGRPLNSEDVSMNRRVVVIGDDLVKKLFPVGSPLGKIITIKKQNFTVIGTIKRRGSVLGQSLDNRVIIPITVFMKYIADEWDVSVAISVKALSLDKVDETMDEAIGIMRGIRGDQPWMESSFAYYTNSTLSEQFEGFTKYVGFFGIGAGIVALVVAGVGIMNIMLVTVKERTREIGVRKALGAKRRWILQQFIIEAITLCQLGGGIGIILGLMGGVFLSLILGTVVAVPLHWIGISIGVCTFLGVFFGAYPAWKASKLDPIEALRYE
ncbi:MAG: ABC transporter permease [Candidatus Kapaibacterium sp.]|jgi:putative ABC transport system permease protein